MSGAKSKNKGKTYERDVANFLSELYQESFTRVPYSGAYVGGKNIVRTETLSESQTRGFKGDIIPPDTFPLLVIEAKNYGELQWHNLALGKEVKQLDTFIQQAQESCEANDKWLLCVKISRQGEFVLWDPTLWKNLQYRLSYRDYHYVDYKTFWEVNKDEVKKQSKKEIV